MTREEALQALADRRRQIDEIDRRLLALLNERTRIVEQIGCIKKEQRMPVYEPRREDEIFRNVAGNNDGPLPVESLKRIFERILDEMRSLQHMRNENAAESEPRR